MTTLPHKEPVNIQDPTLRVPTRRFNEKIIIPLSGMYFYLNEQGDHLHEGDNAPCKCKVKSNGRWKTTIREPQGEYQRLISNYNFFYYIDKKGNHTHGYRNILGRFMPCTQCETIPSFKQFLMFWK